VSGPMSTSAANDMLASLMGSDAAAEGIHTYIHTYIHIYTCAIFYINTATDIKVEKYLPMFKYDF
jgi:hypothetical protein